MRQISTGYLDTMGTPLLRRPRFQRPRHRKFTPSCYRESDCRGPILAREEPIGRHIANSRDMIQREIVGVVSDVKFNALNIPNSEENVLPLEQVPWPTTTLIVHLQGNPEILVSGVRAKIAELDASLPISNVASMESVVASSVAAAAYSLGIRWRVLRDSRCCSPPLAFTE